MAAALRDIRALGFELVAVSNQGGVARGYMTEADVQAVNEHVARLLAVPFGKFYYCPHHTEGIVPDRFDCECRKPKAGLLQRPARELGVALSGSVMIGDSLRDLVAGRAVGARTVLVLTGQAAEFVRVQGLPREADCVVPALGDVVPWLRANL